MDRGTPPHRHMTRVGLLLLVVALVFGACVEPGVTDLDDIRAGLAREGAVVRTIASAPGYPFAVGPTRVAVDGREIRIFEYEDAAARETDSSALTMDGYAVHGVPIDWTGPPHYWAEGRVLVVYTGSEESMVDLLTRVLGPPLEVDSG